jgi:flagellar biosynthesis protein FliR
MRIDISLLPALAAAFMLVFARIGAMVMLLPGLGESNIPVRIKLAIALVLTLGDLAAAPRRLSHRHAVDRAAVGADGA